jgi:hypothetical protein
MSGVEPIAAALVALLAGGLASSIWVALVSLFRRAFKRDEEQERARLRGELLGAIAGPAEPSATAGAWSLLKERIAQTLASPDQESGTETEHPSENSAITDDEVQREITSLLESQPGHQTRFALLLVDYYAYGLTQARRSFAVSLSFSFLGGLVLIAGVALAIFHADTNGQAYAAVVTSVAGVLTSSIGVLFHRQAAHALKHMEEQTNKLRQDMKAERDVDTAVELLNNVTDKNLQSWLQAALILQFTDAELPNISPLVGVSHMAAPNLDGQPDNDLGKTIDKTEDSETRGESKAARAARSR